jgi:hypothetical protein
MSDDGGFRARMDWTQDPGLARVREALARKATRENGTVAAPDGDPNARPSIVVNEVRGNLHDGPGWMERQIAANPVLAEQHAAAEKRRVEIYADAILQRQAAVPRPPIGDQRPALLAAIQQRNTAQSAFDTAKQAVEKSDALLHEANALLSEHDGAERGYSEGLSEQVRKWIAEGCPGKRPAVAPPASLSAARQARAAAEADLAAITKARSDLVDALEQARGELQAATAMVHACAAGVLAGELAGRALLARARLDEFLELANEIAVASRLHFSTGILISAPVPIACSDDVRSVLHAYEQMAQPDLAPPVRSERDADLTEAWRGWFSRLLADGVAEMAEAWDGHPDQH